MINFKQKKYLLLCVFTTFYFFVENAFSKITLSGKKQKISQIISIFLGFNILFFHSSFSSPPLLLLEQREGCSLEDIPPQTVILLQDVVRQMKTKALETFLLETSVAHIYGDSQDVDAMRHKEQRLRAEIKRLEAALEHTREKLQDQGVEISQFLKEARSRDRRMKKFRGALLKKGSFGVLLEEMERAEEDLPVLMQGILEELGAVTKEKADSEKAIASLRSKLHLWQAHRKKHPEIEVSIEQLQQSIQELEKGRLAAQDRIILLRQQDQALKELLRKLENPERCALIKKNSMKAAVAQFSLESLQTPLVLDAGMILDQAMVAHRSAQAENDTIQLQIIKIEEFIARIEEKLQRKKIL